MNIRINIFLAFTLFFGLFAIYELSYGGSFFFSIITLVGLAAIAITLWTHMRFKLIADVVIIEQPFRTPISVELDSLVQWRTLCYYIRGQQKKTLVLILRNGKKIILSNDEYKEEFEEVLYYVKRNYKQFEKPN